MAEELLRSNVVSYYRFYAFIARSRWQLGQSLYCSQIDADIYSASEFVGEEEVAELE